MRVVITGHRPNKLPGKYNWAHRENARIIKWMTDQLRSLNPGTGIITGCTGMALGVDQMFAFVCQSVAIPYIAFIPCRQQERMWPAHAQEDYKNFLKKASEIRQVHDGPYYNGCMQARNLAMRDWALEEKGSILLAVWNGSPGGTGNMVKACGGKMDIIYYDQELLKWLY